MKLETKFNVGDEMFFISENNLKVIKKKVTMIRITVDEGLKIYYFYDIMNKSVYEGRAFKTQEELLKSL